MGRCRTAFAATLAAAFVAAGTAAGPAGAAGAEVPTRADLAHKNFAVKSWRVGGDPVPLKGKNLAISFGKGGKTLSAYFGCNQISGTVKIVNGRLRAPSLATTKVFCEKTAEQETALLGLLASSPGISLDGRKLVLTSGGAKLSLRQQAVAS